jgi:hypothetical protein
LVHVGTEADELEAGVGDVEEDCTGGVMVDEDNATTTLEEDNRAELLLLRVGIVTTLLVVCELLDDEELTGGIIELLDGITVLLSEVVLEIGLILDIDDDEGDEVDPAGEETRVLLCCVDPLGEMTMLDRDIVILDGTPDELRRELGVREGERTILDMEMTELEPCAGGSQDPYMGIQPGPQ